MHALPVLMVGLGVLWAVIVSWRMREPAPRRGTTRVAHPASSSAARNRAALHSPTPLADEVEDWLRQQEGPPHTR